MIKKKFCLFIIFAIFATIANLLTQRLILSINSSLLFYFIAIFLGTLIGLIIKFFLDKRWVFFYKSNGIISEARTFSLYSSMGVVTTIIFWVTETIFWLIWKNEMMREIGALLGLSIGYLIKYKLDLRFVFNKGKY